MKKCFKCGRQPEIWASTKTYAHCYFCKRAVCVDCYYRELASTSPDLEKLCCRFCFNMVYK